MLIQGGRNIGMFNKKGEDKDWLEIKTFGDELGCETTRGNWLMWKGKTQGLARGNLGSSIIENAYDFLEYAESDQVLETMIDNLVSMKEMLENKWDLVTRKKIKIGEKGKKLYLQATRSVNLGPDGKRKVLADGIHTRPFIDKNEASKERNKLEYLSEKKIRKTTENILLYLRKGELKDGGKKELRIRGSRDETIIRVIITLILQEQLNKQTYSEI
jgi:hypothetical protein